MPNIASVLKAEITRLARKESRDESEGLKKAVAAQRIQVTSLKSRVSALESLVKRLAKNQSTVAVRWPQAAVTEDADSGTGHRFSAKGMATNRKRLELSAADFGLLVGTSGQSVYAWESGKAKPRVEAVAAIAALRGMGKREVADRLAALKA